MGRRGRPPLPDPDVIRTYIRYAKLLDAGMSITAAEKEMLKTGEPCQHLTSRQGVRKRLIKGDFYAFCATAILVDFSYKTTRN